MGAQCACGNAGWVGSVLGAAARLENDSETCAPACRAAVGCRSAIVAVADAHPRTMLVGDLLHHRQAEPGALALGGDVGLEGALQHLVGEAGAIVVHRQAHGAQLAQVVAHRLGGARAPGRRRARPPHRARSAPGCGSPGATGVASPTIHGRSLRAVGAQVAAFDGLAVQREHLGHQRVQVQRPPAWPPAAARSRGTR